MTDDLVQFLRDRLDEDEALALEAPKGPWHIGNAVDPTRPCHVHTFPGARMVADGLNWLVAEHIARHDPARVLREVEAKRQIVDGYALTLQLRDEAATRIKAAGDTPGAEDLDTWDRAQREAGILRDPVALLALPYADHPEYRADWRP